jgi:hypothetical protein
VKFYAISYGLPVKEAIVIWYFAKFMKVEEFIYLSR